MKAYIDEIKKLQAQVDSIRRELVEAKRREMPKGCLVVDFGTLGAHEDHVHPNVFVALLFNAGCRQREDLVWITPQGEEVRSPFGWKPALGKTQLGTY